MDRLYCLVTTAARTWVKLMVTMAWLLLLRSCMYVRAVVLKKQTHFYTWFCIAFCFLYVTINRDGDIILWFCLRHLYTCSHCLCPVGPEFQRCLWHNGKINLQNEIFVVGHAFTGKSYRLTTGFYKVLKSKFWSFKKGEYI